MLPPDHISYSKWKLIDQVEVERGQQLDKVREKILSKDEMLGIITENSGPK